MSRCACDKLRFRNREALSAVPRLRAFCAIEPCTLPAVEDDLLVASTAAGMCLAEPVECGEGDLRSSS